MPTPVQLKRNGTPGASAPSSLLHGELALNYGDARIFWRDASNVIQSFTFQSYALASHTHSISDVTGLQTALDGKASSSHTHAASDITSGTLDIARIANDAVTYAKIQNVSATDRLLGRSSAGAGDVEEITCTSFGRSLIDDADAATARTTLGVQPTASPAFTGAATFANTGDVVPLTVTNTGTVNSFVVNDASGDSDPFVIDAAGRIAIGATAAFSDSHKFAILGGLPSSAGVTAGFVLRVLVPSSSTNNFISCLSNIGTEAASYTVNSLEHYAAAQQSLGAGSAIGSQYGFVARDSLTGATNNFGFWSNIASGTGRWNFYANGTAQNYFGGQVTVASPLVLTGTVAGNVRQLRMQTSGSTRWEVGPGFDAESGSNVGSTFWITRWSDAGAFLGTPISIDRATGRATFENTVVVPSGSVSSCSVAPFSDLNTGLYFPAADVAAIVTNGTERVRVGSGGRVQFFANSEKYGIQINKGATGNGPFLGSDGADILTISTAGGAERVRVDASGNVGIGATPSTWGGNVTNVLELKNGVSVASNSAVAAGYLHTNIVSADGGATYTYKTTQFGHMYLQYNGEHVFYTAPSGTAGSTATLTARLTISSDNGKITAAGVYNNTVGGTNRDVFVDSGGLIGYVSSIRESKTDIVTLDDVSWLSALSPVSYRYRKRNADGTYSDEADGVTDYGLIAEDVEAVKPELCFYDMVDGEAQLRGVTYSKLITPMLRYIQQLEARIAALEERING